MENDYRRSMHPRVCWDDLTYPRVACFGSMLSNNALAFQDDTDRCRLLRKNFVFFGWGMMLRRLLVAFKLPLFEYFEIKENARSRVHISIGYIE